MRSKFNFFLIPLLPKNSIRNNLCYLIIANGTFFTMNTKNTPA